MKTNSNRKWVRVGWLVIIVLLARSTLSWAQARPPALVEVALVVQKTIAQPVIFVGTVEPRRRSLVASEIQGIVEQVRVEEGQLVQRDDILVQLRRESLEIALRARQGAAERFRQELVELKNGTRQEVIAEMHAAVLEAEAEMDRAQRGKKRQVGLSLRGVAAQQALENADTAFRVAQQRLARARASHQLATRGPRSERIAQAAAQYQTAQAEVARLRYDLTHARVRAPFTGFVVAKRTEVGQWLNRGDPVVTLIELSEVHITVPVPERYISHVQVGTSGEVLFDALPHRPRHGKVIRIIPQATESRTFPVTIELDNPEGQIKSGFFARVTLFVGEQRDALLVPKDAIVSQGSRQIVFAVRDGKAIPVPIQRSAFYEGFAVVKGALQPGEQVVVRGNERLRPAQPVRLE